MSLHHISNKILWLASYPKSGNTWFRAFLTALMNEGDVEINKMKSDGIFSDRFIFEYLTDIDSRDLYDEEAKNMLPDVYRYLAEAREKLNIIKVHDAFGKNSEGVNLIPEDVTHSAIYFIRNPLDIAGSMANHNHSSIESAVQLLNDKDATFATQPENLNRAPQMRQLLLDWSGHVNSWTLKPSFPVCVLRYEDMLTRTKETFRHAVDFLGWDVDDKLLDTAIQASSFEQLKQQESEKGFREKARKSNVFFRSGTINNWERELTKEQIESIKSAHRVVMEKYGYL